MMFQFHAINVIQCQVSSTSQSGSLQCHKCETFCTNFSFTLCATLNWSVQQGIDYSPTTRAKICYKHHLPVFHEHKFLCCSCFLFCPKSLLIPLHPLSVHKILKQSKLFIKVSQLEIRIGSSVSNSTLVAWFYTKFLTRTYIHSMSNI